MEAPSSSSARQGSQGVERRQFSRKLKWESRGDLKLNRDIQERAPKSGARSSYYLLCPFGIYLNRRKTKFRMMVSTMLIIMQVTMGKKN